MTAQLSQTDPEAFLGRLDEALSSAAATGGLIGLIVIHVENFDRLVSAFGYRAGNRLVASFAERLGNALRPGDTIARISDSKFAVVAGPLANRGLLGLAANKIVHTFASPLPAGQTSVKLAIRMGMAMGPEHADEADDLLRKAETALLAAVHDDCDFALYSDAQSERATQSLSLELELDAAIEQRAFEVHYQPKISTADFRPCGAEALLRWTSPTRGPVSPDVFVPLAERAGRMEQLTALVLNTALRHAAEWPARLGGLDVSVNVTPRETRNAELVTMVSSALSLWGQPAHRLRIEVTEHALISDPAASFRVLNELRDLGVRISIDDFGTGYSSLAYFKNIPADELKIDKSFVLNMLEEDGDRRIVRAVIELSKSFGLEVTAEGVENARTAAMLAALGCDCVQGFYYSRALPQREFIAWLDAYQPENADPGQALRHSG